MTERDATGIELLLSQPEIVAWLEQDHSTVDADAPTFADTGEPLDPLGLGPASGEAVEPRRSEALEATAAERRFLASVSHELRSPLSEIVDSVRSVSRNSQSLPPSQIDDLGRILVSAEHLLSRVEEIIDTTS